jgi:hypothetical protein
MRGTGWAPDADAPDLLLADRVRSPPDRWQVRT